MQHGTGPILVVTHLLSYVGRLGTKPVKRIMVAIVALADEEYDNSV